ncbi:hypothetical protein Gorai_023062 [Gossypium raimondii]|uniref:Uncharacterized protein n=1 Tax=Gossypium raimondii TaxID=29730 RepID=A0A7J8NV14_GOSRA|nr:hypothetical protein [Gossypium raimondii]
MMMMMRESRSTSLHFTLRIRFQLQLLLMISEISSMKVKQGLAGFYYLIRTMGILQGRYLSTRGGFAPFLQSRVMILDLFV